MTVGYLWALINTTALEEGILMYSKFVQLLGVLLQIIVAFSSERSSMGTFYLQACAILSGEGWLDVTPGNPLPHINPNSCYSSSKFGCQAIFTKTDEILPRSILVPSLSAFIACSLKSGEKPSV